MTQYVQWSQQLLQKLNNSETGLCPGSHDGDDELSDGSDGPNDDAAVAAAEADADSTDVEDLSGEFDDADEAMCVMRRATS